MAAPPILAAPKGTPTYQPGQTVPQSPAAPQQPAAPPPGGGGNFNQLHPRDRSGKWILKKGDGYGASGPDQTTSQLQQRLNQLGYKVPVDGKFGVDTEDAVKSFQTKYGLDPNGAVDAATIELLQNPAGSDQGPSKTYEQAAAQKASAASAAKAAKGSSKKGSRSRASKKSPRSAAGTGSGKTSRTKGKSSAPALNTGVGGPGHLGTYMLSASMNADEQGPAHVDPAVSNLQSMLNTLGYKLKSDGIFGQQTEAAVKQVQAKYGLQVDGIVGPITKGLLLGLEAHPTSSRTSRKISHTTRQPKGAVTAMTKQARPTKGAGKNVKMKIQGKQPRALHHAAPAGPEPDLEENQVAKGWGVQPSLAIKDGRGFEGEPIPENDQPVWDQITGAHAVPPAKILTDGRDVPVAGEDEPDPDVPDPEAHVLLDDRLGDQLREAIEARKNAKDGFEFGRALARERLLRQRLEEATWNAHLHPRDRTGKWSEVFDKIHGAKVDEQVKLGPDAWAMKTRNGHTLGMAGGEMYRSPSMHEIAGKISAHLDRQDALKAHGERAVHGLSDDAAARFTHDHALGPHLGTEREPEAHEMYSQVYSQDPHDYVKSVFSQNMTPEGRREAERTLQRAKLATTPPNMAVAHARDYFDVEHHDHVVVDPHLLKPYKDNEPEQSIVNAEQRMRAAQRGETPKRKPISAERQPDGSLRLTDGQATTMAAQRMGLKGVAVQIKEPSKAALAASILSGNASSSGAPARSKPSKEDRKMHKQMIKQMKKRREAAMRMQGPRAVPLFAAAEQPDEMGLQESFYRELDRHADAWMPTEIQLQESAKTAALSVTPSPFSTSTTSNWVARVGGLPAYIQNVAKGIMKSGKSESAAIASAIAVMKRWAAGVGNVSKEVQAAAAKALAELKAKGAASRAKTAAKAAS